MADGEDDEAPADYDHELDNFLDSSDADATPPEVHNYDGDLEALGSDDDPQPGPDDYMDDLDGFGSDHDADPHHEPGAIVVAPDELMDLPLVPVLSEEETKAVVYDMQNRSMPDMPLVHSVSELATYARRLPPEAFDSTRYELARSMWDHGQHLANAAAPASS